MKLGLHLRLSLLISLFSLFAVTVVSMIFYQITYQRERQNSLEAISELQNIVYHSATIAAYSNNSVIVDDILKGLISNELVARVSFESENIHQKAGKTDIQSKIAPIVRLLYSPFDEKELLGELSIIPSEKNINQRADEVAIVVVQQIVLILSLSTVFITFLIWLIIGKPITVLAHNLAKVDPSKNSIRLSVSSMVKDSELDFFALTVNELLDRVQEQIIEERNLRDNIELIAKNFQMIFDLSSNALVVTDISFNLMTYNTAYEMLVASTSGQKKPHHDANWLQLLVKNPDELKANIRLLLDEKSNNSIDVKLLSQKESVRHWVSISAREAINTFNEKVIIIFINDISRQHEALYQSELTASTDHLTNLLNRRVAERKITHMIHEAYITHQSMALLLLDLDGFKAINDIYGHEAGDTVLINIAQRLKQITRKTDAVSRWGGDEFVIGLDGVEQEESLRLAQKILDAVSEPITLDHDVSVNVGASIGIAICPESAIDFITAFEYADLAMYEVKRSGKQGVKIYSHQKHQRLA